MGRLANSDEYAELTGAKEKDPQRYKGEIPKNSMPLIAPPRAFNAAQKKVWNELIENALPGVLTMSDFAAVESLALLLCESREIEKQNRSAKRKLKPWLKKFDELQEKYDNEEDSEKQKLAMKRINLHLRTEPKEQFFPTSRVTAMISIMARMGMTPSDRTRLRIPDGGGHGSGAGPIDEDDYEIL